MGLWRILLVVVFSGAARVLGGPTHQPPPAGNSLGDDNLVGGADTDCLLRKDSPACLRRKLFSLVDRALLSQDSLRLAEGVTVVRTAEGSFSRDGAPRGRLGLDEMLASRLEDFLATHSLRVDVKGSDVLGAAASVGRALEQEASSVGEERGKKKKAQKILLPLLLALKLKAAALIPLALGAIALIAGKALLVGKIALVLAAIIGLKKLLSQQQKTVTYEIVSHPHHSSSHEGYSSGGGGGGFSSSDVGGGYGGGGGGGGWGRSAAAAAASPAPGDAHGMAYRAYAPQP
ncbi:keratin, type II cytoskeletal 1b-like [Bacillus rossius redtenbacheri]|uniref:keratin, type II cytoskeletal 1b-like n=1 Tax=Bacillus rossius redtenbacheri TaxID=93214 RepID=UPI002FDE5982